ncbi:MAG: hypothetical protein K0R54_4542 [Clostridiaceae bacterium]|jgi:hypothetical protein|nr:hypothetical protein [Clostridiaceae bacterium]
MKINNKNLIIILLTIGILLVGWSVIESINKNTYEKYSYDVNRFEENYQRLMISLDTFVEMPTVENYSEIQFRMGVMSSTLTSLYKSMRDCYKKGLIEKDISPYEGAEVVDTVNRELLSSSELITKSINLNGSRLELDKNKIKELYENLNSLNALLKPYYDDLNHYYK